MAHDIDLADDIVADINGQTWDVSFTAERTWLPEWEVRDELDALQVSIQPGPRPTGEIVERIGLREAWPIVFAFARRLNDTKDRDEIDALINQVDAVREFLFDTVTNRARTYTVNSSHNIPRAWEFLTRFDPKQLDREKHDDAVQYAGNFLSVFQIVYERLA